jgi:cellulose synthase (UDP-forming)
MFTFSSNNLNCYPETKSNNHNLDSNIKIIKTPRLIHVQSSFEEDCKEEKKEDCEEEVKLEEIKVEIADKKISIDNYESYIEKKLNNIFIPLLSTNDVRIANISFFLIVISYLYFWLWVFQTIELTMSIKTLWILWLCLLFLLENAFHIWTQCFFSRIITVEELPSFYNEKNISLKSLYEKLQTMKIAMIVTKTPSEPFQPLLFNTLSAMKKQNYIYSYDVWLATEKRTNEVDEWCEKNQVKISCRDGLDEYHQENWPKRTRCKEGNLRYFYDTYGDNYDVVFQFDSDHIPEINYLSSCVLAFTDPEVSYIAMPSINDRIVCWIASARMYNEAYYYGPYQMSFSYGINKNFYMPNMTGSHYAIRVKDLKAIGGLGPELDEDLSTTMMFTSNKFKGVYSLKTMASGAGPVCFEDAMCQEYQWCRSAILLYSQWRSVIFPKNYLDVNFNIWLRFLSTGIWYISQSFWLLWFEVSPIVAYYMIW